MKYLYLLLVSVLLACVSCREDNDGYTVYNVSVQLVYPAGSEFDVDQNVKVKLTDLKGSVYESVTDENGEADFIVPAGLYTASTTDKRYLNLVSYIYNGLSGKVAVTNKWDVNKPVALDLVESQAGQVIIKELYTGGCPKSGGASGSFSYDKYVILYNNSDASANLENLCLGMVIPYNSNSKNNNYTDGELSYEKEGYIPAGTGIWYYPRTLVIEPGEQVVIALTGALNHIPTYSQSVDLSNPEYHCAYDIAVYTNSNYYPSPSERIPASHYWSAVHYGAGNAWPLSNTSPAFFIFKTEGVSPAEFANDTGNVHYHGSNPGLSNTGRKVPVEWILDGIEIFNFNSSPNYKRLTAEVDAGYTELQNQQGYTSYRNVDEEATKAIAANEGKLVYNYGMGTEINGTLSTDPSGIDAEASLKNGAFIIYQDTNNSTNDFHQRKQASLRD